MRPTITAEFAIAEGYRVWDVEETEAYLQARFLEAATNMVECQHDPELHSFFRDEVLAYRRARYDFDERHCVPSGFTECDRACDEAEGYGFTEDQQLVQNLEAALFFSS